MNISIVIPNFNGYLLLKKNLPKILDVLRFETEYNFQIVIVDDGSVDKSIDFIESFISDHRNTTVSIALVKNEKNYGFSTSVNRGVAVATGELILLLNTDVTPEKGFLKPLLGHFYAEEVFAVGCLDKSIEHGQVVPRGRGVGSWKRGFLVHAAGSLDKTSTLWASGGSSMFRKSLWEKLKGMNELYNPYYWEDIDLSYRALKSGYRVLFEGKSVVVHEHEEGSINTQYNDEQIKEIAYRNQILFVWLNITDGSLMMSHAFWLMFYHVPKAILRVDVSFLFAFFRAFLLVPNVLQSRLRISRFFKLSDKTIVEAVSS